MSNIRSVCLAFVTAYFLLAASAANAETGEFSCNYEDRLHDTFTNMSPVTEEGVVFDGCSILPDGYVPEEVREVGQVYAPCGTIDENAIVLCRVTILEAVYEGNLYYIADGWLDGLRKYEADDYEHMQEGDPLIPIGIPCEKSACLVKDKKLLDERMLVNVD